VEFWNFLDAAGTAQIRGFLELGIRGFTTFFSRFKRGGLTNEPSFGTWNRVARTGSNNPKMRSAGLASHEGRAKSHDLLGRPS
jgi:hypothetical protein